MFSERDRQIFEYESGQGKRFADPLAIFRELAVRLDGDLAGAIRQARPPQEENGQPVEEQPGQLVARLQAEARLLGAVRAAFGMAAFDPETGQGAFDELVWKALNSYLEWCEGNESGGERSPT